MFWILAPPAYMAAGWLFSYLPDQAPAEHLLFLAVLGSGVFLCWSRAGFLAGFLMGVVLAESSALGYTFAPAIESAYRAQDLNHVTAYAQLLLADEESVRVAVALGVWGGMLAGFCGGFLGWIGGYKARRSRREESPSYSGLSNSYAYRRSGGYFSGPEMSAPGGSPFLAADRIAPGGFLDDPGTKTLKEGSAKVGTLSPGGWRDAAGTQVVRDEYGQRAGKIVPGGLFDKPGTQVIKGESGNTLGKIETTWLGDRVVKNDQGDKVGKITKNWWTGETEIRSD